MKKGELIFFCGKMGAGKSTKASEISQDRNAVLLSEDEWLESLYPNKVSSLYDYVKYSNLIKPQIKKLVQSILATGTDVVMDFPANTISQREWFREIYAEVGAPHHMVYLDIPNNICLEQIAQRRIDQPQRAATDTVEMFEAVTKFFAAPKPEEGFNITKIVQNV
ncbi:ATP-binding protein [Amphritea balenae]|uniref:ATP-binding protein n=1 Tax=Amphritea balenae TaxID=452629 RepID=A0A3P1SIF0_9GAMM|nr:ATP-binding protein [Amphritea balenae]RRC96760.1 ATP-binding protein [Amphritea balenae]